ncbi:MAG: alanine:cation symporter family protein [Prevotellaceae bacterium]|nr:alanine:cation symporter family protein [Candidatus Faecinaster equi]
MEELVNIAVDIIWSPVLIVLLIVAGLYFTIRTQCVQLRKFPLMIYLLFVEGRKKKQKKSLSSFQAFWVALSGRVGTGNIVGVATAIAFGGPGSVFWMWVITFFGASTAFAESTLANKYKFNHNGTLRGGPAAYISEGLHQPIIGNIFAIMTILGYGMLLVLVQSNSISGAVENSFHITPIFSGVIVAFFLGLVIIGGMSRIANVATSITPFMAIIYILMSITILVVNYQSIPKMFELIFSCAFGANQLFGGVFGSAIAMGVKRGLFSNEAGQGGGAIVSASANVNHPAKQGLVQAFSVYIDTLLVCTATAFMILSTESYNVFDSSGNIIVEKAPELGNKYVTFTQSAIDSVFSGFGSGFVAVALLFFAFTTIMAYYFYAESSFAFLFRNNKKKGNKREKTILKIYKLLIIVFVVVGSVISSDIVWKMGDIGIGLTTWINIIVLLFLFPKALALLKDYERKLKK